MVIVRPMHGMVGDCLQWQRPDSCSLSAQTLGEPELEHGQCALITSSLHTECILVPSLKHRVCQRPSWMASAG